MSQYVGICRNVSKAVRMERDGANVGIDKGNKSILPIVQGCPNVSEYV
jgi:hypothetical protein